MRSQDDASLREIEVLWGLSGNRNDVGDCGNNDGNERENGGGSSSSKRRSYHS